MMKRFVLFIVSLTGSCLASADAPVVDLSNQMAQYQNSSNGGSRQQYVSSSNLEERVNRLEQQVGNLISMNLPDRIDDLRDRIQKLQGELEVLSHKLDRQALYQDKQTDQDQSEQRNSKQEAVNSKQDSQPPKASPEESTLYQKAYGALQVQRYDESVQLFKKFLNQYPKSQYAANAHYWLGELYYVDGQAEQAKRQLKAVSEEFPDSSKVPAAQLKLALIAIDEGRVETAQEQLQAIVKNYPKSSAANLAKKYLKQLRNL